MFSILAACAKSFLKVEYLYLAACIVLLSADLTAATEWETTASSILWCYTSILCGWIDDSHDERQDHTPVLD